MIVDYLSKQIKTNLYEHAIYAFSRRHDGRH